MSTPEPHWPTATRELRGYVARRVPAADIDDVVQDILLKVHAHLSSVDEPERLGPWMNRVARATVADHHRRRASRTRREEAAAREPVPATPPRLVEEEASTQLAACMLPFIDLLPPKYAEALRLVEIEGRTQREAAELSGVTLSAMKSRTRRGRAMLRARVEQCCHVELDARNRVTGFRPRVEPECCDP